MDIKCPRCESESEFEDKDHLGGVCPDCKLRYWWDYGYVSGTNIDYTTLGWEKYDSRH